MKNYRVAVPITGVAFVDVKAETEKEAIDLAFANVTIDNIDEWDAVPYIVKGNVFYGLQNEVEVECNEEEEE
jgi:hypothetical protein